jgi:hypothetical protein
VTAEELKAEIAIEVDSLRQVVNELEALRRDMTGHRRGLQARSWP